VEEGGWETPSGTFGLDLKEKTGKGGGEQKCVQRYLQTEGPGQRKKLGVAARPKGRRQRVEGYQNGRARCRNDASLGKSGEKTITATAGEKLTGNRSS